ncbi:hypothetical protein [Flavobacterium quisquiliarum]|uniref:Uncharacterized protein n=1 Tax=Flavobacterium quisquiliarum TaxID=1834436 RepID=A0ABV8W817_9FLAO|nr:hypothetical protein [Flavobacterium quisquiliarum]MBW1656655.1 hypothetical protein [Flavobacterium quisquiliarum]
MRPIHNFELKSIRTEEPPQLTKYNIFEGYQIFQSNFNNDLYVLFDHDFEIYRCIEFVGMNKMDLDKSISIFITDYYVNLSDEEKNTPTIYLPKETKD